MSRADRIMRRRSWAAECPPAFGPTRKQHNSYADGVPRGHNLDGGRDYLSYVADAQLHAVRAEIPATEEDHADWSRRKDEAIAKSIRRRRPATFHTWSIARGHRHKTFQLRIRGQRLEDGKRETSTRMVRR